MTTKAPEWLGELTGHYHRMHAALGDMTRALHKLVPLVLGSETVVLDVNGQAAKQFRVPFKCITVDSQSAKVLTVEAAPLSTQPNAGPGVAFVRAGGFVVCNLTSYTWSIYGGNPGDLVTVTAYANPQPPYAR